MNIMIYINTSNEDKFTSEANKSGLVNDLLEKYYSVNKKSLDTKYIYKDKDKYIDTPEPVTPLPKVSKQTTDVTAPAEEKVDSETIIPEEPRYEPMDDLTAIQDVFPGAKPMKTTPSKHKK